MGIHYLSAIFRPLWMEIGYLALSLLRTLAPWNVRFLELLFPGTVREKVMWNFATNQLSPFL